MAVKQGKAVILNYLIPLHISYLAKAFPLKWVIKKSKDIHLYAINPITGKKEVVATIHATVNTDTGTGNDYVDLEFWINGKLKIQRIELIAKKIKLTGGHEFFFGCPMTGKRKRKLFLHDGRFVSRQAIPHGYYLSEVQSKKYRNGIRDLKRMIRYQNTMKQGKKSNFKKHYAGNPTKRYLKVIEAAGKLNRSW
ncbi:MAG TPA: hypothetical protein VNT20_18320 [Flavisolibacter sp.]|jgi:hypothetical protein|nr:hypothetical protein [Flavisolibacter sp.]